MNNQEFKRVWEVIKGMDDKLDSVVIKAAANATNISWIIKIQLILLAMVLFLLTGKWFLGMM